MAKKVGQIRYYGGTSGNTAGTGKRNYPEGLTRNSLRYGNVFNSIYPIVQLGIQTLPGVKIYINNQKIIRFNNKILKESNSCYIA